MDVYVYIYVYVCMYVDMYSYLSTSVLSIRAPTTIEENTLESHNPGRSNLFTPFIFPPSSSHVYIYLYLFLFIYSFVHLSIHGFVYDLSIHLFVYVSIYLSVRLSISLCRTFFYLFLNKLYVM